MSKYIIECENIKDAQDTLDEIAALFDYSTAEVLQLFNRVYRQDSQNRNASLLRGYGNIERRYVSEISKTGSDPSGIVISGGLRSGADVQETIEYFKEIVEFENFEIIDVLSKFKKILFGNPKSRNSNFKKLFKKTESFLIKKQEEFVAGIVS